MGAFLCWSGNLGGSDLCLFTMLSNIVLLALLVADAQVGEAAGSGAVVLVVAPVLLLDVAVANNLFLV